METMSYQALGFASVGEAQAARELLAANGFNVQSTSLLFALCYEESLNSHEEPETVKHEEVCEKALNLVSNDWLWQSFEEEAQTCWE